MQTAVPLRPSEAVASVEEQASLRVKCDDKRNGKRAGGGLA